MTAITSASDDIYTRPQHLGRIPRNLTTPYHLHFLARPRGVTGPSPKQIANVEGAPKIIHSIGPERETIQAGLSLSTDTKGSAGVEKRHGK